MNLLALDTSTSCASVALSIQGEIHAAREEHVSEHAGSLLPMIDRLLVSMGVRLNQLDGLIFGRGPGSFTGLRIACSVAKGLAYAHDLPVYPVSGLAAIAQGVRGTEAPPHEPVLAMIDARMNQVYWSVYEGINDAYPEQVTAASAVYIQGTGPLVLAGVGLEPYVSLLPIEIQHRISEPRLIYPEAKAMIELVQAGFVTSVSAELAMPVYVRNQVTQGVPHG